MVNKINSLPEFLVNRYKDWKENIYSQKSAIYKKLALEKQSPKAMIISCCDSRVHATSIFGADEGELFIHRNIANLVPPFTEDGLHHGTSSAIEYGIKELKIPHLIILGHTGCGGIKSGHKIHSGQKNTDYIFVNKWLNILLPAYIIISKNISIDSQIKLLEEESIKISINNLLEFPDIKDSIKNNTLSIHGLIYDIRSGKLKYLNRETNQFKII